MVDEIARKEPLITASKTEQVRKLVQSRCSHIKTIKSDKSHNIYKVDVRLSKQVKQHLQSLSTSSKISQEIHTNYRST